MKRQLLARMDVLALDVLPLRRVGLLAGPGADPGHTCLRRSHRLFPQPSKLLSQMPTRLPPSPLPLESASNATF